MIPRPKNSDNMDDVLKMQEEYLRHKNDGKFKPAATVKKIGGGKEKQSLFAQKRKLKTADEKSRQPDFVIGEIVERKHSSTAAQMDTDEATREESAGFPKPKLFDYNSVKIEKGKSLFSQIMESEKKQELSDDDNMEVDQRGAASNSADYHEENLKLLQSMSEQEILEEQQKLLNSLDPKIVEFVRSRHKKENDQKKVQFKPESTRHEPTLKSEDFPVLDILKNESAKNWLHFDVLEPEKLEWTRDIEKTFENLKPGQTYEARFDWKGFLLPFIDSDDSKTRDDRELYLHGDDPHRPGYTLQELLRLARANVLQQRVAALNAIAGIINIYNQGYYDGILELPISKMFFFLRFAMDENTPAIIEASSRALAYLFYNDTDETLLDIAYETKTGFMQPILDNRRATIAGSSQEEEDVDLESTLKQLSIEENRKKLFESNIEDLIDENDREKESFNDFHLAEVNLIECIVRTDIIERITYILTVTDFNDVTLVSCMKILIRIARSSRSFAMKILEKKNLIENLIGKHLTKIEGHEEPHFIVLKLFRVISSYDRNYSMKLKELKVLEKVKSYVQTVADMNVNVLKLQIECFRFLRMFTLQSHDESVFTDIAMAMRYLLEWHYQFLDFQLDNHFIIRQHAAALLHLLGCGNMVVIFPMFSEIFKMCSSKWFTMAARYGIEEFSQKIILSSCLDVCERFASFSSEYFYDFVDDYLTRFMKSTCFTRMSSQLCEATPLFKEGSDRCNIYRPLINVGSIVRRHKKSPPTLVFTQDYSIFVMKSLLRFINAFDNMSNVKNQDYYRKLCELFFTENIENYLQGFSIQFNRNLSANWFLKMEIDFIYALMISRSLQFSPFLLKVAFNLLNCFTQENLPKILSIFENFVFSDKFNYASSAVNREELDRWKYIYNGVVMSKLADNEEQKSSNFAVVEKWNQTLLNESWPYSLLLVLLYNAEVNTSLKRIVETELSEEDIILTTLKFTSFLEKNDIHVITKNQQLMYLMLVYLGKNLNFLDSSVKELMRRKLKSMKNFPFTPKFNIKLNGEKSFEALYTMFLDTFQGNSYGDDLFSVIAMIPLAQCYNVKWRKLVWSEYVASMRFINCEEQDLLCDFNEYLHPVETDESLVKSYRIALSTNQLREGSLPWKIAKHHVDAFRKE